MKYTDRFFEFPIRVYDRYTAQQAQKEEENLNVAMEGEWIQGLAKIPYKEITVWTDYFDSEKGVEGVRKDGWDATIVWTKNEGIFIASIVKSKFEKLLNNHVEAIEAQERLDMEKKIQYLKDSGVDIIQTT
ncbi:MAG TPA: hypothetical protein PLS56_01400 [Candidatus Dojkabacteria bacterium]|nr:hypothetical protein [Candidatus Dojkabacteria bacterium]